MITLEFPVRSCNNMASPHAHLLGHILRDENDCAGTGMSAFKDFIPASNFRCCVEYQLC